MIYQMHSNISMFNYAIVYFIILFSQYFYMTDRNN